MNLLKTCAKGVLASLIVVGGGCFRSLPPPTVREAALSPEESYEKLCGTGLKRAEIIIHERPPLSGILECGKSQAVIVLFNQLQVRVRTIAISRTGMLKDENSFLSTYDDSAELLISEIETALGAISTQPRTEQLDTTPLDTEPLDTAQPRLSITTLEPQRLAQNKGQALQPAPPPSKKGRN
jgi:hypothetical protein